MADIFREVDEEVRREKATEFWNKYQYLIIGAAVLIVAAAGGWRYWQYSTTQAAQAAGENFVQAIELARAGKSKEAQAAFEKIAKDGPAGYASLAKFRAASEIAKRDRADAVKAFDSIAEDPVAAQTMRDAARIRSAYLLVDTAKYSEMKTRLESLTASTSTFRLTALELLSLSAYRGEEYKEAASWLDKLIASPNVPQTMRRRAEALQGLVAGSKKVSDSPAPAPAKKTEPEKKTEPVKNVEPEKKAEPAKPEPAKAEPAKPDTATPAKPAPATPPAATSPTPSAPVTSVPAAPAPAIPQAPKPPAASTPAKP